MGFSHLPGITKCCGVLSSSKGNQVLLVLTSTRGKHCCEFSLQPGETKGAPINQGQSSVAGALFSQRQSSFLGYSHQPRATKCFWCSHRPEVLKCLRCSISQGQPSFLGFSHHPRATKFCGVLPSTRGNQVLWGTPINQGQPSIDGAPII